MKLLCFQAKRFWWKSFSKTLEDAPEVDIEEEVADCLAVFMHVESKDSECDETRARAFKQTLKHIKWLANKRELEKVVLHSFTHLGGVNAAADFTRAFMAELGERLRTTEYQVWQTPFGYFCEWDLSVHGESLAKVWKEI